MPNLYEDTKGKITRESGLQFIATDLGSYGLPNVIPDAGKYIDDIVNGTPAWVESDGYGVNNRLTVLSTYDTGDFPGNGDVQYLFQFLKDPTKGTLMTGMYYVDGDDLVKI